MKKTIYAFLAFAAIGCAVLLTGGGADAAASVSNYFASPASGSKDNELTIGGTWSIGGTDVTSTAAELNILDGVTATAAELDEYSVTLLVADISAEATHYVVLPHAGTISKLYTVTNGAVGTADVTFTCNIGATPITSGVVTIATAASAAGDVDSATPSAANTITAGAAMNCVITGGGAGGTPAATLTVVVSR